MELFRLIVEKLSQYNILTNILPGTVLCLTLKYFVGYDLIITDNYYLTGVLFYFAGMINGRIGSLIVEPLLKKTKWIVFSPYPDFVSAEKEDSKITVLSQENNIYRSYVSVLFISSTTYLYNNFVSITNFIKCHESISLLFFVLVLFLLAYRKQTNLVRKRVETTLKKLSEKNQDGIHSEDSFMNNEKQ